MPSLKVSVPHTLGQEAARERLVTIADAIERQYGAQVKDMKKEWADENTAKFGFRTMGQNFSGTIHAAESSVDVDLSLPFAAIMFKGRIEKEIKEKLGKLMA